MAPDPPPLRAGRLARDHRDHPVLDPRRACAPALALGIFYADFVAHPVARRGASVERRWTRHDRARRAVRATRPSAARRPPAGPRPRAAGTQRVPSCSSASSRCSTCRPGDGAVGQLGRRPRTARAARWYYFSRQLLGVGRRHRAVRRRRPGRLPPLAALGARRCYLAVVGAPRRRARARRRRQRQRRVALGRPRPPAAPAVGVRQARRRCCSSPTCSPGGRPGSTTRRQGAAARPRVWFGVGRASC